MKLSNDMTVLSEKLKEIDTTKNALAAENEENASKKT
jgi:hypothetical protein